MNSCETHGSSIHIFSTLKAGDDLLFLIVIFILPLLLYLAYNDSKVGKKINVGFNNSILAILSVLTLRFQMSHRMYRSSHCIGRFRTHEFTIHGLQTCRSGGHRGCSETRGDHVQPPWALEHLRPSGCLRPVILKLWVMT